MDHITFTATLAQIEANCNALMVALLILVACHVTMVGMIGLHIKRGFQNR